MNEDELRREASLLIGRLRAEHEDELRRNAIGYVIVVRDDEFGTLSATGLWPDYATAKLVALRENGDLHRDHPDGEPGWTSTVVPVQPRTDTNYVRLTLRRRLAWWWRREGRVRVRELADRLRV